MTTLVKLNDEFYATYEKMFFEQSESADVREIFPPSRFYPVICTSHVGVHIDVSDLHIPLGWNQDSWFIRAELCDVVDTHATVAPTEDTDKYIVWVPDSYYAEDQDAMSRAEAEESARELASSKPGPVYVCKLVTKMEQATTVEEVDL